MKAANTKNYSKDQDPLIPQDQWVFPGDDRKHGLARVTTEPKVYTDTASITIKSEVDVQISQVTANALVKSQLCKLLGWNPDYWVSDGNVCRTVEAATSHSFTFEEVVRPATQNDIMMFRLMNLIPTK